MYYINNLRICMLVLNYDGNKKMQLETVVTIMLDFITACVCTY